MSRSPYNIDYDFTLPSSWDDIRTSSSRADGLLTRNMSTLASVGEDSPPKISSSNDFNSARESPTNLGTLRERGDAELNFGDLFLTDRQHRTLGLTSTETMSEAGELPDDLDELDCEAREIWQHVRESRQARLARSRVSRPIMKRKRKHEKKSKRLRETTSLPDVSSTKRHRISDPLEDEEVATPPMYRTSNYGQTLFRLLHPPNEPLLPMAKATPPIAPLKPLLHPCQRTHQLVHPPMLYEVDGDTVMGYAGDVLDREGGVQSRLGDDEISNMAHSNEIEVAQSPSPIPQISLCPSERVSTSGSCFPLTHNGFGHDRQV